MKSVEDILREIEDGKTPPQQIELALNNATGQVRFKAAQQLATQLARSFITTTASGVRLGQLLCSEESEATIRKAINLLPGLKPCPSGNPSLRLGAGIPQRVLA